MTQAIIKIGNSFGVTLPMEFIKKNNLKKGSRLTVTASNSQLTLSTKVPKPTVYEPITDAELASSVREVEAQYSHALDQLTKIQ